jgi:hypothetical protein
VVAGDDDPAPEARPPLLSDLVGLCRRLNAADARYVVIGGMAVIQAGFPRATGDIDLLIDASRENQRRVREALMGLPDQAVRDMTEDDLDRYAVVRVADEFVVDLMKAACGIEFAEAHPQADVVDIDGVAIPFASPELLLRMKDTYREKDKLDRAFLEKLLEARRK